MITKDKLKVGRLYKTQNVSNDVVVYRVWLGEFWSMGTSMRCHQKHIYYQKNWQPYEAAIPVNKHSSPFDPNWAEKQLTEFTFKITSVPKKKIRFLNRPEV